MKALWKLKCSVQLELSSRWIISDFGITVKWTDGSNCCQASYITRRFPAYSSRVFNRSHQDHLIRNLPRKDQKTQPATGQLHNLNNPSPVISSLVSTNVCRMVCLETSWLKACILIYLRVLYFNNLDILFKQVERLQRRIVFRQQLENNKNWVQCVTVCACLALDGGQCRGRVSACSMV